MGGKFATRKVSTADAYKITEILTKVFPKFHFVPIGSAMNGTLNNERIFGDVDYLVHTKQIHEAINGVGSPYEDAITVKRQFVQELVENLPGIVQHHYSASVHMVWEGIQIDFSFVHPDANIDDVAKLFDPPQRPYQSIHQQVVRQYLIRALRDGSPNGAFSYNIHRGVTVPDVGLLATTPDQVEKYFRLRSFSDIPTMINSIAARDKDVLDQLDLTLQTLKTKPTSIKELMELVPA